MKEFSTESLLTLGMALTADKAPISLTREDAQALSDRTISDIGITDVALDSVQRACLFGEGDTNGEMPVLSRGWAFIYTQDNNGLHVRENRVSGGGPNDALNYTVTGSGEVAIYIDDDGVSMFYCHNLYTLEDVVFENVAVISADDALRLFKERLIRIYSYHEDLRTSEERIEALSVSLMSMAIADAEGEDTTGYREDDTETCLLVPVWGVRCRITDADGMEQSCTYPFSATDGGALLRVDG